MGVNLDTLLRQRFTAPAYAYIPQVPNGTGRHKSRTADAIAMSLWPSRGIELHGIECKISRSDWKRELDNPAKAEACCKFCDRWWLVVSDEKIVQTGELPPTWGLLAARGEKLVCITEAPKLDAQPITKVFLAGLLRAAAEWVPPKPDVEWAEKRYREGYESGQRVEEVRTRSAQSSLELLLRDVEAFEQASGVDVRYGWRRGEIGEAVKFVMDGGFVGKLDELRRLKESAETIAGDIQQQLNELGSMQETPK